MSRRRSSTIAVGCGSRPSYRRNRHGFRRCTARACSIWTLRSLGRRGVDGAVRRRRSVGPCRRCRDAPPRPHLRHSRGRLPAGPIRRRFGGGGGCRPCRLAGPRRRRDRSDGTGPGGRPRRRSSRGSDPPSVLDISRLAPKSADELLKGDAGADAAFTVNARGRFMADLDALARRRLARLGIERIYGGGECTYSQSAKYFSHRRDGRTGRQASLIWLEEGRQPLNCPVASPPT